MNFLLKVFLFSGLLIGIQCASIVETNTEITTEKAESTDYFGELSSEFDILNVTERSPRNNLHCNHCKNLKCGRSGRKPKIVGGSNVYPGKYPWAVALLIKGNFFCGGSLITEQHILTAAHCFYGLNERDIMIAIGVTDLEKDMPKATIRTADKITTHKKFDIKTFNNDISIIKLNKPVKFSEHISPICVVEQDQSFVGQEALITGWGREDELGTHSRILNDVSVPIISNSDCKHEYKFKPKEITTNMICAGYKKGKIDACQGDSGGPFMIENRSKSGEIYMELNGVVSWGIGCARRKLPGVYTRIANYKDFIDENTADSCTCSSE